MQTEAGHPAISNVRRIKYLLVVFTSSAKASLARKMLQVEIALRWVRENSQRSCCNVLLGTVASARPARTNQICSNLLWTPLPGNSWFKLAFSSRRFLTWYCNFCFNRLTEKNLVELLFLFRVNDASTSTLTIKTFQKRSACCCHRPLRDFRQPFHRAICHGDRFESWKNLGYKSSKNPIPTVFWVWGNIKICLAFSAYFKSLIRKVKQMQSMATSSIDKIRCVNGLTMKNQFCDKTGRK